MLSCIHRGSQYRRQPSAVRAVMQGAQRGAQVRLLSVEMCLRAFLLDVCNNTEGSWYHMGSNGRINELLFRR
jgi:hypothetical protein